MKKKTVLLLFETTFTYWGFCILLLYFFQAYYDSGHFPNGLSANTKLFSVGYQRDLIDQFGYDTFDLIDQLSDKDDICIIKETSYDYSYIYDTGYSPNLKLVAGRWITSEEYLSGKNVAIISDKLSNKIIEDSGLSWIEINGDKYEVVGIFLKDDNCVYHCSSVMLSMSSSSAMMNNHGIEGRYWLDGKNEDLIQSVYASLNERYIVLPQKSPSDNSYINRIEDANAVSHFPIKFRVVVSAFIVLAVLYFVTTWISCIKKELKQRWICGASLNRLRRLVLSHLLFVPLAEILFPLLCCCYFNVYIEGIIFLSLFWFVFFAMIGLCITILMKEEY